MGQSAEELPETVEGASEIWQTHIFAPEQDYEVLASVIVETPERDGVASKRGDNRALILSTGGEVGTDVPELNHDNPIALQASDDDNLSRAILHCGALGVGYYLVQLETHGIPEEEAYRGLCEINDESDGTPIPMDEYSNYVERLTERDRRLRLLDLLELRIDQGDWASEPYQEVAKWRDTGLDESAQTLAERIARQHTLNPKQCYRTVQQAAITHKDNHRVQYAEGICFPKQAAQVMRHGWLEIDGKAVEITLPWHFFDGHECVYFGTSFDSEEVADAFERRGGGFPMILDDEQLGHLDSAYRDG